MSAEPSNNSGMSSPQSQPPSGQGLNPFMDYQMGNDPVYPQPAQVPNGSVPLDPMAPIPRQGPVQAPFDAPAATPEVPEETEEDEYDEVWIAKAKEIVDQTRQDPFRQSNAISKIKADYLKARYDKNIKVAEDSNT